MKLIFVMMVSSFCVYGQQLDNPFELRNGLNVNDKYNFTNYSKASFSSIAKPNYGGMLLNSDNSNAIAPLYLPNIKLEKINLVGLTEGLFFLTRDILSGFAK